MIHVTCNLKIRLESYIVNILVIQNGKIYNILIVRSSYKIEKIETVRLKLYCYYCVCLIENVSIIMINFYILCKFYIK